MFHLPPVISARYRPATPREVRALSFGLLKAPRNLDSREWQQQRGTLNDQAIFGPVRDFECACGKFRGPKYQSMICDRCGVKLTTQDTRRQRFGHIELPRPIVHPFAQSTEMLCALPVLPAAFVESPRGNGIANLYDELVRSTLSELLEEVVGSLNQLVESLLPTVVLAHEWNLQEAEMLAGGLSLVPRVSLAHDTCSFCCYPLEGLHVLVCPDCGRYLR